MNCFFGQHGDAKYLYFHYMLRDASGLVQIMTRLCGVVSETNRERDETVSVVIKNILYTIKLANTKKFYHYDSENSQIFSDYIEL